MNIAEHSIPTMLRGNRQRGEGGIVGPLGEIAVSPAADECEGQGACQP